MTSSAGCSELLRPRADETPRPNKLLGWPRARQRGQIARRRPSSLVRGCPDDDGYGLTPPLPQSCPNPGPGVLKATDTPVALRTLSHTIGTCELYYDYLVRHILTNPVCRLTRAQRKRHYDRLANLEALVALAFVWKNPLASAKNTSPARDLPAASRAE